MSTANKRNFEIEYSLEKPEGVNAFLSNLHHIRAAGFDKGDYNAIILLVDFEIAFSRVKITERQRQALHFVFFRDLTQRETGQIMGISQQAVHQLINAVVVKISEQYERDLNSVEGGRSNEQTSSVNN